MKTVLRSYRFTIFSSVLILTLLGFSTALFAAEFFQETKLITSDGAIDDRFGYAVDLSGDTMVAGAHRDDDNGDDSGSAYVFQRQGNGSWLEVAKLIASDGDVMDRFGWSVAIDDGTAVIGADYDDDNGNRSGSAYIFERQGDGSWLEVAKLLPGDGAAEDGFGYSVAIAGDTALVGAWGDDDNGSWSGSAYIFERQGDGSWFEVAKLLASDGGVNFQFGYSVAIQGNTILVGARGDDHSGEWTGSVYVFQRQADDSWLEETKLLASDGAEDDNFGSAVALSGDYALVGAPLKSDNGFYSGAAYIFERQGDGSWHELTKLVPGDGEARDHFGLALALTNGVALIGAFGDDDNGVDAGAAYVFRQQTDGSWLEEAKLLASDGAGVDGFSSSIALSGDRAAIGAYRDDDNDTDSGSVYIFGPTPPQQHIAFDVKPEGCPNPLNIKARGVLPAAVLGTAEFDVSQINPTMLRLQGVPALRTNYEDVGTPYLGDINDTNAYTCTDAGPDGYTDLTMKFDMQAVIATLGPVTDKEVLILSLSGELLDGTPISGYDVVLILKKGR